MIQKAVVDSNKIASSRQAFLKNAENELDELVKVRNKAELENDRVISTKKLDRKENQTIKNMLKVKVLCGINVGRQLKQ